MAPFEKNSLVGARSRPANPFLYVWTSARVKVWRGVRGPPQTLPDSAGAALGTSWHDWLFSQARCEDAANVACSGGRPMCRYRAKLEPLVVLLGASCPARLRWANCSRDGALLPAGCGAHGNRAAGHGRL